MSRVSRLSGAVLSRLRSERTLAALTVLGLLGAVASLVVAGVAPLGGVDSLLYLVALAFPLVGLALGIAALAVALASDDDRGASPPLGGVPESGEQQASAPIGERFSRLLGQAERRRYRGETTAQSEQLHETLVETAVRRLRAREGLETAGAEQAVRDGSWTADQVAAGFLSPERRLPLPERLRGAVDPGRAYRRRLDRTLDAIDAIGETETGSQADPDSAETATDEALSATVFEGELPAGSRNRRTGTWGVVVTLVLLGAGIGFARPILVVGATLGLWYTAASIVASPPGGSVELTRRLSTASGDPGDTVSVEMTVRNTGDVPLVDLSVADEVPEGLPVRSGSPRAGVSLAPGESEQVSYELELRRGEFGFGPVALRRADLTGRATDRVTVGAESEQELRCVPAAERVPLGDATNDYAGGVPTDEGGSGIEFYAVREYESGDPVSAIDWRRYAHRRDLATVEFRAERATRVVCLVDCRESQQATTEQRRLPARDISLAAARRTAGALLETGHPTGVTTIEERTLRRVDPGTGSETRAAVDGLLDAQRTDREPQTGHIRSTGRATAEVPGTLPGEAQVFLFSSVVDDLPLELSTRLRSRGFTVTIISPDVTGDAEDRAVRLAGLERERRLVQARASGADVLDWGPDQPLARVLEEAIQGVTRV
jgi:uncharacterized repeat protein (TIGR01451 family)